MEGEVIVREIRWDGEAETKTLARICHEAFTNVAETHGGMPSDFPSLEIAASFIGSCRAQRASVWGFVALLGSTILGSNYVHGANGGDVASIGPISVDVNHSGRNVGRKLMDAALNKAKSLMPKSIRLVQTGYNLRSLSLYTKLGFDVQEHLVTLNNAKSATFAQQVDMLNLSLRQAVESDVGAMNSLCFQVCGIRRIGDVRQAIDSGSGKVVVTTASSSSEEELVGYCTGLGYIHHAVALSNDALKLMIISQRGSIGGTGFNIPSRNSELFRWCLSMGFVVQQSLTLMSMGYYEEPNGYWLPSIGF